MWSRSRTTNRHRLFCVVCRSTIKIDTYHPDLCVLLGISNGAPPKSLAKKQGLSVRSPKVERRRRNPGARQESDISSWHTGNAHTHISWIVYFQRNKETWERERKLFLSNGGFFCLLNSEIKKKGKLKKTKKHIRKMKNSYGLVEDFVCVRETMGKRRKKADKSI